MDKNKRDRCRKIYAAFVEWCRQCFVSSWFLKEQHYFSSTQDCHAIFCHAFCAFKWLHKEQLKLSLDVVMRKKCNLQNGWDSCLYLFGNTSQLRNAFLFHTNIWYVQFIMKVEAMFSFLNASNNLLKAKTHFILIWLCGFHPKKMYWLLLNNKVHTRFKN